MEVFAELLVLLVLTRALGEAAERVGQPASVGEILAGVLLAWAAIWFGKDIPFLVQVANSEALEMVAHLGIFLLVLYAGIEMEPREIAKSTGPAFLVAVGGMVVPLTAGFALAWYFLPASDFRPVLALLTGVALSISAIPATVKVLGDLGLLHSKVGETVVSAAVFDDILGLFLLAILLAMIETGDVPDIGSLLWLLGKVGVFFAITITLGAHVYPRVSGSLKAMQVAAVEFSALAAVALAYGLLAELLGMHWIMGAFMAGLYFERARVGFKGYNEMKLICGGVSSGFLGPLFFASIGLRVDVSAVTAVPVFLLLLLAVAFAGKLIGAGLPALWMGLPRREALSVGVGMSARGAVELIVLSIAFEAGLFAKADGRDPITANLFSCLILVGVVTTLLAPILLKKILASKDTGRK